MKDKVPEDGRAREAAEVWRLRKATRVAVCNLWTHPKGGEARLTIDGEWHRGEALNNGLALMELALECKAQFRQKGCRARRHDRYAGCGQIGVTISKGRS